MGGLYALLVGINEYEPPITTLSGCRGDIESVLAFLQVRIAGGVRERVLLDRAATRQAVIDGFRNHLGQAGRGDVALFWFSGHGSEQSVPDEFWHLEPTGFNQTLVCVDSRRDGVPDLDLADKELSVLVDEVAARGPHTVVVLDCCNSGGGTREPFVSYRGIDRAAEAPPISAYLPEVASLARPKAEAVRSRSSRDADEVITASATAAHLALSACRSFEKAKEQKIDGQVRGVFTASLLDGLQTLGPGATYRELLTAAKCKVENWTGEQVPVLYPVDLGGIADQPFLGGTVTRPAATFVLRHIHAAWEVDAGRCHGIPEPVHGDTVVLAVPHRDGPMDQLVRVTEVRPERSLVETVDWTPDPAQQYPVVVASLPLPPATIVVGGLPDDDPNAARLIERAVQQAGPGDGPSPHIRIVDPDDHTPGLRLRVATGRRDGRPVYRILRGDGSQATADVEGHTEEAARLVVARLEHIACWTHIKDLDNPASSLTGAVAIEVVGAEPGDTVAPRDRPALVPDAHGEVRLAYRRTAAAWQAPRIFIRLGNTSDRRLWCVLLDLTDRFRVHPNLFPGDFIEAREVGAAYDGRPIPVQLPPGRDVRPGAMVRDWIKILVAEEAFGSLAFDLPRLDEPPTRRASSLRPRTFVERLGLRATARDMGDTGDVTASGDWTSAILPLVTVVPDG